jgi:hypothetical protein
MGYRDFLGTGAILADDMGLGTCVPTLQAEGDSSLNGSVSTAVISLFPSRSLLAGKTIQTITTLWTLMKQGPYGGVPVVRKSLIVCPGALVKNWEKEFKKWLGVERIAVFAVAPDKKVDEFVISPVYQV